MNNYQKPYCNCQSCGYLESATPTYNQVCNVTNTYTVQDYPHITNYHTHNVNNVVRRHIDVPQYSYSESCQVYDEYAYPMMMPEMHCAGQMTYEMPYPGQVPYEMPQMPYPGQMPYEMPQHVPYDMYNPYYQQPMEQNIYNNVNPTNFNNFYQSR